MKNELLSKRRKVESLLKEKTLYRDSDVRLLARIWYEESTNAGCSEKAAFEFLQCLVAGKLSNSESIRRIRQKLQELNPMLRGQSYEARHLEKKQVRDLFKH
jgi:hypothetical protein